MNNDEEGARLTSLEEGRERIAKHRAEIGGSPAPRERLAELREFLLERIDGSEETRAWDSKLTRFIEAIDALPSETVPTPASPAATPRTDAALNVYDCNADEDVVSADFARTLERELNAREAQIRARLESSPSATEATKLDDIEQYRMQMAGISTGTMMPFFCQATPPPTLNESNHPSWCCQKCGENIGWLGRFMFPFLHKCDPIRDGAHMAPIANGDK